MIHSISRAIGRWARPGLLAALPLISAASGILQASSFSFPDFPSYAGLTASGAATVSDDQLFVIPPDVPDYSGAAWYSSPVDVSQFVTTFDFTLQPDSEGFAFVMQDENLVARGTAGDGIGFAGIDDSIAIYFGTYQNAGDPSGNFISVNTNGTGTNSADLTDSIALSTNSGLADLDNGSQHQVTIAWGYSSYDGYNESLPSAFIFVDGTLYLTLPTGPSLSNLDLSNGQAYVGFTSSTSVDVDGAFAVQDWTFASSTPEPGADLLTGLGFLVIAVALRAKRRAARQ
ncbi:MAG TPA: L-type lectin-domain containing protein [Bryobacteraceae bacterium]|nr:L-type lectin-domain containing protein [Bryobacteraceae bacterium]